MTPLESQSIHLRKMGEEIGPVYSALWQEVVRIGRKWEQYVALFGVNEQRVALMNKAGGSIFRTVQDTLWDDVLLHIARLSDPAKSMNKSNLSILHLVELVKPSDLRGKLDVLSNECVSACQFARDWRNRRIAHRDLSLALDTSVKPLASASRENVVTALEKIEEVLNAASAYYLDSTTFFRVSRGEDAVSLLYLVRDGLLFREEARKKLLAGDAHWSELRRAPL